MRIQYNGLDIDLLPACTVDGGSHDHMVFDKNSASGIALYTVLGAHRALIQPALMEWLSP